MIICVRLGTTDRKLSALLIIYSCNIIFLNILEVLCGFFNRLLLETTLIQYLKHLFPFKKLFPPLKGFCHLGSFVGFLKKFCLYTSPLSSLGNQCCILNQSSGLTGFGSTHMWRAWKEWYSWFLVFNSIIVHFW